MEIEYVTIRSSRRTISISINNDKSICVRAPKSMTDSQITEIVTKKLAWISRKMSEINVVEDKTREISYTEGSKLLYLGEKRTIELRINDSYRVSCVNCEGTSLIISTADASLENVERIITRWYKKEAERIIEERVHIYEKQMDVHVNRIRVRQLKSRWGSCSNIRNVNFNWRLVMAPLDVIDYVVIHELCHLRYMNHSKQFWDYVESIAGNYRECKAWLRSNQRYMDSIANGN